MSPIGEGWPALGALVVAAILPTEAWRWLGLVVGRRVDPESRALEWVRAVATAIIAAFVARVVVFPSGGLAETPLSLRLGAMALGLVVYLLARGSVFLGVGATVAAMIAGQAVWRP